MGGHLVDGRSFLCPCAENNGYINGSTGTIYGKTLDEMT